MLHHRKLPWKLKRCPCFFRQVVIGMVHTCWHHWDGSHFLPAAGNLRFSKFHVKFPVEFVGKKSFQPNREPTNSAGNLLKRRFPAPAGRKCERCNCLRSHQGQWNLLSKYYNVLG